MRCCIRGWGKDAGKTGVSPFLEHQELILGRHENMNATAEISFPATAAHLHEEYRTPEVQPQSFILVFACFCHLAAFYTTQGPVNTAGKGLLVHWPVLHLLSSVLTVQKQPFMTHRRTTGPHSSKTLLRQQCECNLIVVYQLRYSSQKG